VKRAKRKETTGKKHLRKSIPTRIAHEKKSRAISRNYSDYRRGRPSSGDQGEERKKGSKRELDVEGAGDITPGLMVSDAVWGTGGKGEIKRDAWSVWSEVLLTM